jgi:hypothetical protein
MDLWDKLKVSQSYVLWHYKFLRDLLPNLFATKVSWTATITHQPTVPAMRLSVSANNDYAIGYTRQFHNYFAWKPQFIEFTCINFGAVANTTKSIGYYSQDATAPYNTWYDWVRLHNDGTTHYLQIWRAWVLLANIAKSSWDNQTIASAINFNNFNIFAIDFLWLWGAWVRLFTKVGTKTYLLHTYNHAGTNSQTMFLLPNHRITAEVRSTWWATSLDFICVTVDSEWSLSDSFWMDISVNSWSTAIVSASSWIEYAILWVRKQVWYRDTWIIQNNLSIMWNTANDYFFWRLLYNPTIAWTFTYSNVTNSSIQQATWSVTNTVTWWYCIASWVAQQQSAIATEIRTAIRLGCDIDNVMDTLLLTAIPVAWSTNINTFGTFTLRQLQ